MKSGRNIFPALQKASGKKRIDSDIALYLISYTVFIREETENKNSKKVSELMGAGICILSLKCLRCTAKTEPDLVAK